MDRRKLEALFINYDMPMVHACIQGDMGRIETWKEESVMASIGDFCFLAGYPVLELVKRAKAPILVPCDKRWGEQIEAVLGERAVFFTRYATRRAPERFDRHKLYAFTRVMPKDFAIIPIDKEIYFILKEREWCQDLCGCFTSGEDFQERGLGFVATQGGLPVAGAASYAVCEGAVEIEIDTRPDFRRQGLAAACGAKLILECLERELYPGWDAHDRRSLALAQKLGYQLERSYSAYWVERK